MGRGSLARVRDAHKRQNKKKARLKAQRAATAKPAPARAKRP
jgi:hypothetical protein